MVDVLGGLVTRARVSTLQLPRCRDEFVWYRNITRVLLNPRRTTSKSQLHPSYRLCTYSLDVSIMCHSTLHALLGSESHFRGQRSGNIIVNSLRWRAQRRSWYVECLCKATTDAEELSIQATLGKKVERRVLDGVGSVYNGFTGVLVLKAVIPHTS